MSKFRRMAWGVGIGVTGTAILLGLLAWNVLRPRIRTAAPAEVLALVPADLLIDEKDDPAAKERFRQALPLVGKADWPRFGDTSLRSQSDLILAQNLLKNEDLWKLKAILESGEIQFDSALVAKWYKDSKPYYSSVSTLLMALIEGAMVLDDAGNTAGSARLVEFAVFMSDKFSNAFDSMSTVMSYPGRANVMRAVQYIASDKMFPVSECKKLLKMLRPATVTDDALIRAIRSDFQNYALKILPNPTAWHIQHPVFDTPGVDEELRLPDHLYGTYDALATTRELVKQVEGILGNLRRPMSEYDPTPNRMAINAEDHLPKPYYNRGSMEYTRAVQEWRTLDAVAAFPQYIQAHLLAKTGMMDFHVLSSFRWRSAQNATRILLASRLYRADHANVLPTDAKRLLPYLENQWPVDPYTGKPMVYDPLRKMIFQSEAGFADKGAKFVVKPVDLRGKGLSLELN